MLKIPSKVLIYHTIVSDESTPDDKDVLDEVALVSEVLHNLGYEPVQKSFKSNIKKDLGEIKPSFIFNLVESVGGKDSLAYLAPHLFEKFDIPYTGCTYNAFYKTKGKTSAKKILNNERIPTPYWFSLKDLQNADICGKKFLIKSDINHASKDLESTLFMDEKTIQNKLLSKGEKDFFAEEYIEGREFNVSLIGPLGAGKILPIPEIKFVDWPNGKPKIVDYNAKWNESSLEYNNTERSFDFSKKDIKLFESLEDISKKCWGIFNLRGYARVDFRVNENNQPYVLEINANPCISPNAGFVAACKKEGMTEDEIIKGIIKDSCGENFLI